MRTLLGVSFVCLVVGCGVDSSVVPPAEDERGKLLELVARGYYPGRSGQILFVLERGDVMLRKPMGFYRFMHGSPWDYDRHIPMIFYGPGFIAPGARAERVHQEDVAPTMLSLAGIIPAPTMSGHSLDFILRDADTVPRVAVVLVLDGMRVDYLERYADVLPTLSRMAREGASFEDAWVSYVPSVTSAGHTTIATGTVPRVHGIAGNGYYDAALDRELTLFHGLSPKNMAAPGISDLWSLHTSGDAVVLAQGTTSRASVSLAGYGACAPNGRATIMAMFDYRAEGWVTNPDCYVIPDYLASADARSFWEERGTRWRGLDIRNGRVFVMTPYLPEFQVDALISMIEREGVGQDEVPDLVMVNFKSPDYAGHNFGPHADETKEVLEALDAALGQVLVALGTAAGEDGFVVAVTADHGMPSEPDGSAHQRRFIGEMMSTIHDELDPDERRLLFEFLDTANNQLFVDPRRMRELGLELRDVAEVVEALAYVKVAFTENEVRETSLTPAPAMR